MGQGSEKIDLSPSESWDLVQNDQHKLHFTLFRDLGAFNQ